MGTAWLDDDERAAWLRLVAVVELLPGVLDSQLRTDSAVTHFEYYVLAVLSEAPERTLRMTTLAQRTNATLPRLSHVVRRLQERGLVERTPCPEDGRATNARLTAEGWDAVVAAAPGHVATVRRHVVDPLSREQLVQLRLIGDALLSRLDPDGRMTALYAPDEDVVRTGPDAATFGFDSVLYRSGGEAGTWVFLDVPEEAADEIHARYDHLVGGFGAVRVEVVLGRSTWRTSLFPSRERGTFVLPVRQAVRRSEGVEPPDQVRVQLTVLL